MDNSNQPTPQNNQPITPQSTEQPIAPAAPLQPAAPITPANTAKNVRNGWLLFALSVLMFLVGLWFGVAVAASALVSALAGRIGLQNKNKPLAITSLIFCGLMFILFTVTVFSN